MDLSRRKFIEGIGKAITAGAVVPFLPSLLPNHVWVDEEINYKEIWATMHFDSKDMILVSCPYYQKIRL